VLSLGPNMENSQERWEVLSEDRQSYFRPDASEQYRAVLLENFANRLEMMEVILLLTFLDVRPPVLAVEGPAQSRVSHPKTPYPTNERGYIVRHCKS
jgi:hypothetical protein